MAQYQVQDPQGRLRVIEGPDGASDQEVIEQAQKLFGASGSMENIQSNLPAIREFLTPGSATAQAVSNIMPAPMRAGAGAILRAAFPPDTIQSPEASFKQDVRTGNAQDTSLNDLATVQAITTAPQALRSAGGLIDSGYSKVADYLKTLAKSKGAAESFVPLENAAEAGNTIATGRSAEQAANMATKNELYGKIPQDIQPALSTTQSTADSIINNVKKLPSSFQSKKIVAMAADLQSLDKAPIGVIQEMQSTLKDIAKNGEGVEKLYAARLSKSLQADIEKFSATPIMPPESQAPSLEAQDLRKMWGNNALEQSGTSPDVVAGYVKPEVFQSPVPKSAYTNEDVASNLSKANSYYRDMMSMEKSPIAKALDRAAIESKANVIFKSGRVEDVNAAKALLGDEGFKAAQGQFYQKLVNAKDISAALDKYTPEFLHTSLGPKRVEALRNLAHFNSLVSKAKKAILAVGGLGGAYEAYRLFKH